MKTKTYSSMEVAIQFAKDTLGMRNWDTSDDSPNYAACWNTVSGNRKVATVTRKGKQFKLTWDPEYENRRPKMIGL